MADFILTTDINTAQPWEIIGRTDRHILAIDREPTPHRIDCAAQAPYIAVAVSNTDTARDVFRALREAKAGHFVDKLGVTAGLIWNTETDAFCVFRDKFGLIPIQITETPDFLCVTTSPQKHAAINAGNALNRTWFARFLYGSQTSSRRDVWRGTERLYPGECRAWGAPCLAAFLASFGAVSDSIADRDDNRSDLYWKRRRYAGLNMTFEEAAEELRACHARAVGRIPTIKPPIFTLSGGLDSTGIVAAYARAAGAGPDRKLTTVSLLSKRHASCDESEQIEILKRSLPIDAHCIDMEEKGLLTDADVSETGLGYGPLCGPGLQINLLAYQAMAPDPGSCVFITGYGGNFLVKVRTEAIWRDLLTHFRFGEFAEYAAKTPRCTIKYMAKRFSAYGLAKLFKIRKLTPTEQDVRAICRREFCERYRGSLFDETFAQTHFEERASIPMSDGWECLVRAIDATSRSAHQYFYDPLLDAELYDVCSQIPPHYWDYRGKSRAVYRAALKPLLPPEIIAHPKSQSFDNAIIDAMRNNLSGDMAHSAVLSVTDGIIDGEKLEKLQRAFIAGDATPRLSDVWRLTAADWWGARISALATAY